MRRDNRKVVVGILVALLLWGAVLFYPGNAEGAHGGAIAGEVRILLQPNEQFIYALQKSAGEDVRIRMVFETAIGEYRVVGYAANMELVAVDGNLQLEWVWAIPTPTYKDTEPAPSPTVTATPTEPYPMPVVATAVPVVYPGPRR